MTSLSQKDTMWYWCGGKVHIAPYCIKWKYTPKDQRHVNRAMQNMQGAGEDNLIKTGNYYYTYTIESNSHRSTGQEINKKWHGLQAKELWYFKEVEMKQ